MTPGRAVRAQVTILPAAESCGGSRLTHYRARRCKRGGERWPARELISACPRDAESLGNVTQVHNPGHTQHRRTSIAATGNTASLSERHTQAGRSVPMRHCAHRTHDRTAGTAATGGQGGRALRRPIPFRHGPLRGHDAVLGGHRSRSAQVPAGDAANRTTVIDRKISGRTCFDLFHTCLGRPDAGRAARRPVRRSRMVRQEVAISGGPAGLADPGRSTRTGRPATAGRQQRGLWPTAIRRKHQWASAPRGRSG